MPQVKSQAIQIDVTAVTRAQVTVSTAADPARDARLERFWGMINRLIFDDRRPMRTKGTILARFGRQLARRHETEQADYAGRLAASYGEIDQAIAHW